jgi:hypothetical protein
MESADPILLRHSPLRPAEVADLIQRDVVGADILQVEAAEIPVVVIPEAAEDRRVHPAAAVAAHVNLLAH